MNALANLYRDLRDRRLLPVVVILAVAIVAVPLLLRQGFEEPATGVGGSARVAPGAADAALAELDPAIVSQAPELRAFRKRLASFQSTNPFHQEVLVQPDAEADAAADALPTGELPLTGGSVTDPVPTDLPTDTGEIPGDPPLTDPPPTDAPPVDDGGLILYTTRVDVRVGAVGDTEVQEDVEEFSYLPDVQHPVVQYLFGDFDLTSASFVVSPSVLSTEGDGKCAPSRQSCQFLLLDVGEEQTFEYDDGTRYGLELLGVNLHQEGVQGEDLPEGTGRTGDVRASRTLEALRARP